MSDPAWAATARGCIFDTLPPGSPAAAAARAGDGAAVAIARSTLPLSRAGAVIALGPCLAAAAGALLGAGTGGVVLFGDQFIAKPPSSSPSSAFAPHADADALPGRRRGEGGRACVSIWVALDDFREANGGLALAAPTAGTRNSDSPPLLVPLTAPAGTAVAMRGDYVHASSANASRHSWRRAYMPQYGAVGVTLGAGWAVRVPVAGV